ncbi:g-type lectin s-receptor-like serine/threonine-protein kinase lecrk2 [Quercus suber]|uniref:G-type lectin s-receptor-like serine/threonine-protein kinase lecrk2 n=1 Tax=Quercus suber TaxID=58331 RepID=A0AAW0L183_QUESU
MPLALPHPLSLLFLVLLLPYFTRAQTSKNQSLGSFLTADNKDTYWAAPKGEFAFGFQQIGKGGYLLAIWFNKIPEKTIVWSANGDNLVPGGSKVELTKDGKFVLNDPTGNEIWKVDSVGSRFTLQSDGNLVLETRAFPLDSSNSAYWSSKTLGSGYQVVFNRSGSIYLIAKNGSTVNSITSNAGSTQDFYQRAILEYDGVLRHYVYPKSSTNNSIIRRWPMAWSSLSTFIPSNICKDIIEGTGGGACGFNSYCKLGDDQRPNCQCPDGYTFVDPDDVMKGCKPNFLHQSCDKALPETDLFYFQPMQNTDWPLSDYEHFQGQTEDWCRKACLEDCFCAVAIFRNGECWKKKFPVSNGRMDSSVGGIALIKIRKDNSTFKPSCPDSKKKDHSTLILIGSVLLSSSVFLNLLLFLAAFLLVFRFNNSKPLNPVMAGMNLPSFTYEELREATNGFKEELGSDRKLELLVENDEEALSEKKRMEKYVMIALWCIQEDPSLRPTMKKVVQMMEGAVEVSVPPDPSSFIMSLDIFILYTLHTMALALSHLFFLLLVLLLPYSTTAQISRNQSLGSSLNTQEKDSYWASPSGDFAFGFQQIGKGGYLLAIWFNKIPEKTIVWSANGGNLVQTGSKVELTKDGQFVLSDPTGKEIWKPALDRLGVAYAAMLDTGNFVLASQDTVHLWQSFDHPTDTMLPTQKMSLGSKLVLNDEEAIHDLMTVKKYVMIAIWCIQEDPLLRPTMKKVVQMMEGAVEVSVPPNPSSFISSI